MRKLLPILVCIALWGLGAFMLFEAITNPAFKDAEGFLDGLSSFAFATSVAAVTLGISIAKGKNSFGFWLALAIVGQAIALQLIEAGSPLRYQHYRPLEAHPLLLAAAGLHGLLVAAGIGRRIRQIWTWTRDNFKPWQIVAMALLVFVPSATVSAQPSYYVFELPFAAFITAINLGNVILLVWTVPTGMMAALRSKMTRMFGKVDERSRLVSAKLDRFVALVAIWVTLAAALLNLISYEQHPHVPDEVAYLFQARSLAAGKLTSPAPPVPDAFEVYLLQVDGDVWYSTPPPGWPAVLAIGVRTGAGWLVNPILAGLNILLGYLVLLEFYDRRLTRIAIFLLGVSPWYVFMGMSYMTHMFSLTCALLATLGVLWARRMNNAVWAWLGGLALGMMVLTRPLEAAGMAALLGFSAIGFGGRRLKASAIAGLAVGAMISGATTLVTNQELTGDPTSFPIMVYMDQYFSPNANALGFGPDRGMGWAIDPYPGHSPRDAVINANLNAFMVNVDLFGWSIGSLPFIGILLFAGRLRRSDYAMLAVIMVIFVLHFFYYFSGGPDFGARYWFLMIVPLVALSARGLQILEERFPSAAASGHMDARAVTALLLLSLMAVINFFPWRAIDKYHHFRGMRPDVRDLATEYEFGRSLVLIHGDGHPDYSSAAHYNPIDLRDDVPIYAWDRSQETRDELVAAYADRPIWIVDGPTITRRGFEVVAGPLTAGDLRQ